MVDASARPENVEVYKDWLRSEFGVALDIRLENHYHAVSERARAALEESDFWQELLRELPKVDDSYFSSKGYRLLLTARPILDVKSFDSFFSKTFRKNVVTNDQWPNPPGRWLLPPDWVEDVRDIVRTELFAKYLDGVLFLRDLIEETAAKFGLPYFRQMEAKEKGYYAAHVYVQFDVDVPRMEFDTETRRIWIEIQVATQLQEVLRKLLHRYYEDHRESLPAEDEEKWQWEYLNPEFAVNYLGHILHYIEGMIVEIRDRERTST